MIRLVNLQADLATLPINRIELVVVSLITYRNEWSIFRINGSAGIEVAIIPTIVAAAASVPSSFVSINA